MRIVYFDCFSGAAGDMILGALVDAGASENAVRAALARLAVGGWELRFDTESRGGIVGTRAVVTTREDASERAYRDIVSVLESSALPDSIAERAMRCFKLLAEAEARVHGLSVGDVHLHEVGGLDALVDIVGACAALEDFLPARIVTSTINVGGGTVDSAHGSLPVPAPAVVDILRRRGAPIRGGGERELLTPTGAAILAAITDDFSDSPEMTIDAIGYGVGAAQLDHPNLLRALVGEAAAAASDDTLLLRTNVDDITPEHVAYALDKLLDRGARDAWVTPILMKKGRPGFEISVLCDPDLGGALMDVLYRETSTLGVRMEAVGRDVLERKWVDVDVAGHPMRVKLGIRHGEVVTASPEYEDARRVAEATDLPLKRVYELALKAAASSNTP